MIHSHIIFIFSLFFLSISQSVFGADFLPPIIQSQPESNGAAVSGRSPLPLTARVKKLERVMDSQSLVDMMFKIESLQTQVMTLRGLIEQQEHELAGIKKRQRDLYLDIDRRLQQTEKTKGGQQDLLGQTDTGGHSPVIKPGIGIPGDGKIVTNPDMTIPGVSHNQSVDPLAEQEAYKKGLAFLKAGKYDVAIGEFNRFLVAYPKGQYAANAQYWLGESNFVLRNYKEAIAAFSKVINAFSNSKKSPDAMLKIGYTYYELKNRGKAEKVLNQLVKKYPNSTAATLAKNRLHRMRLESN